MNGTKTKYCIGCGKKIDRNAIDLEERNVEEKTAKINENENSTSRNKGALLIIIFLCILLIALLYNTINFSVILFFIEIIGNLIVYLVFMGILMFLCGYFMDSH